MLGFTSAQDAACALWDSACWEVRAEEAARAAGLAQELRGGDDSSHSVH